MKLSQDTVQVFILDVMKFRHS